MNQPTEATAPSKDYQLNRLSYNILGVLLREPKSGYEIVSALEKFRPVNISQVYPLLASMEEKGLLTSVVIVQIGRPDKRIYNPTPRATEVLRDWIAEPTDEPVLRDDFLSKVYSFWICDTAQKRAVIEERIAWLDSEIAFFSECIDVLHAQHRPDVHDPDKWPFCREILMQRRLVIYREERLWCLRVLSRLDEIKAEEAPE